MMNKEKKIIYVFFVIIILLFIFIVFLVFNKNKSLEEYKNISGSIKSTGSLQSEKKLTLKVITDKRNPSTNLDLFIENLKNEEDFAKNADIKNIDFSDDSIKSYMKKNNINYLPAIIFSTNDFESTNKGNIDIKNFLSKLNSGEYYLELGANYDPFSASKRGFSTVPLDFVEELKKESIFNEAETKKIIWLDYSDLSCPYCQDFHNSDVIKNVLNEKKDSVSKTYKHFVVNIAKYLNNTKGKNNAEDLKNIKSLNIIECFGKQSPLEYLSLIDNLYKKGIFKENEILEEIKNMGLKTEDILECSQKEDFLLQEKMQKAKDYFGVKVTPTSVFLNTKTGEYKLLEGFDSSLGSKPYLDIINSLN